MSHPLARLLAPLLLVIPMACGDTGNPGSGDGDPNPEPTPEADPEPGMTPNPDADPNPDMGPNTPDPDPPMGGPNTLIDRDALMDPSTLDIEIDLTSSGTFTSGTVTMYLVSFTFTSQTYAGNAWRHQASLYLPLESDTDLVGIVQRGTENEVSRVSDASSFNNNFGIGTASNTATPIMLLNDVPARTDLNTAALAGKTEGVDPRCLGGPQLQPERIAECMFQVVHASGDLSLDPFLANGVAFSRALTAATALPEKLAELAIDLADDPPPAINIKRGALFASSFRAGGLPIAAAIDPRVEVVYQSTSPFGAFDEYFALQKSVWSNDFPLGDPTRWETFLSSPAGADYKQAFDPAEWPADLLAGKSFYHAWGTQMTFAPLRAFGLYRQSLPEDTHQFLALDYADGLGTSTHLAMWQVALSRANNGRAMTKVTANHSRDQGNIGVTASIEVGEGNSVSGLLLYYVSRQRDSDDLDFRDAVWDRIEMEPKNENFIATFSPTGRNTAYSVVVIDSAGVDEAIVASDVVVVEP